ncbi:hypothetical protein NUACC26_063220 [Scytonema sp. NUACC26]
MYQRIRDVQEINYPSCGTGVLAGLNVNGGRGRPHHKKKLKYMWRARTPAPREKVGDFLLGSSLDPRLL